MKIDALKTGAIAALLVTFAFVSPAHAADSGFYIEVDLGRSNVTDTSAAIDDSATGFRFAGGYRFVPWLSIDLGYVDFGTIDTSLVDPFGAAVPVEARANGQEFSLVGRIPLGDRFALSARAGKLWWDAEVQIAGMSESSDGNDFSYGAGVEMNINETVVITATWQKYELSDTDVDLVSIGLRLQF